MRMHGVRRTTAQALFAVVAMAGFSAPAAAQTAIPVVTGLNKATGLAINSSDVLYVGEGDQGGNDGTISQVSRFTVDGALLGRFGSRGAGPGQFYLPGGMDFDDAGNVYVADIYNGRFVSKFTAAGEYVTSFGSYGAACTDNTFNQPYDVAVAGASLYVTNSGSRCVQNLTTSGVFVRRWGTDGAGPGQFQNPTAIEVGADTNVYVADDTRVQRFTADGTFLSSWPAPAGNEPYAIVAGNHGDLYVAYDGSTCQPVERRSLSGALLATACRSDLGIPAGGGANTKLAVDSKDRLFLSDGSAIWRIELGQPTASITPSATRSLTGEQVTFDASASRIALDTASRYEWDLDDDGTFETDTGPTPTASRTYAIARDYQVKVRVTAIGGKTSTAQTTLAVKSAPPAGPVGVSVNTGAQYTTSPQVTLSTTWPAYASTVTISNDGGFANAQTFEVTPTIPWHLDASGPERLPKTVYLRFDGSTQTYTDDIILDQRPPTIATAEIALGTVPQARTRRQSATNTVTLNAADDNSGLDALQLAFDHASPDPFAPYSATTVTAGSPRYVRVRDRAGNVSDWVPLTIKAAPSVQSPTSALAIKLKTASVRRGKPLTVTVVLPRAATVNVRVIRGQTLISKRNYELEAGRNTVKLSTKRLKPGTYKVRVTSGKSSVSAGYRVLAAKRRPR